MAISITIGLIVAVAALNIIASLVLLVMEKSRDIAILKTMGASSRSIMTIFMLQGLIIGLVGTFLGAVLGLSLSYVSDRYQLIRVPTDVYQISHVPFRVLPLDFTIVVLAAVVICFVATIYPSRQAASLILCRPCDRDRLLRAKGQWPGQRRRPETSVLAVSH